MSNGQDNVLDLNALKGLLEPYTEGRALLCALLTLLNKKKWTVSKQQLAEALPHYIQTFNLDDLRKTLNHLDYKIDIIEMHQDHFDSRLAPVIFIDNSKEVFVLSKEGDTLIRSDEHGNASSLTAPFILDGMLCIIQEKVKRTKKESWFKKVCLSSKLDFAQLVLLGFFSNLFLFMPSIYIMMVYDRVLKTQSYQTLFSFLIGILIALIAYCFVQKRQRQIVAGMCAHSVETVDGNILSQILRLPANYIEVASVPSQIARIQDFERINETFSNHLLNVLLELPFILIYLIGFYYFAGALVWVPIMGITAYAALFTIRVAWERYIGYATEKTEESWQGFLIESIQKIYDIRLAHFEFSWLKRFSEKTAQRIFSEYRSQFKHQVTEAVGDAGLLFLALALLVSGVSLVEQGALTMGGLIASMAIIWRLMSPVRTLFNKAHQLISFHRTLKQIDQITALNQEEYMHVGVIPKVSGEIEFHEVGVRYLSDRDPALVGASFKINPGELIVLTGPNGSGKSTLFKLLLRLYQPQVGSISIDGQDIRQISHNLLRKLIAYVPQDTQFFYGTISQNLRLANPMSTQADLERVCQEAFILEDIQQLPDGFETRLHDNEVSQLPASFKQRLQLARSLLVESNIVLLDEPASHFDEQHDEKFVELLLKLKGQKTVLMSSHRPSHFNLADKLITLEAGQIKKIETIEKKPPTKRSEKHV